METRILVAYALIGVLVLACAAIAGTFLGRRARERRLWRGGNRRKPRK